MIPIHELLNRIRWDPEFAKGNFELGYYYRTETRINLARRSLRPARQKDVSAEGERCGCLAGLRHA